MVDGLTDFSIMGNDVHVGASVGVSKIHAATTPLVALREADIALYDAKAKGRSRWRMFEGGMADALRVDGYWIDGRSHQLSAAIQMATES